MLNFVPLLKKHLENGLNEMINDNIQYVEIKVTLGLAYDLDKPKIEAKDSFHVYKDICREFEQKHPNFKAKIIYSPPKSIPIASMQQNFFKIYHELCEEDAKENPGFLIGFDLTGPEESTPMLDCYLAKIKKTFPRDTKFFFHAGETNFYGVFDENLVC